jgi:hypothetical protein
MLLLLPNLAVGRVSMPSRRIPLYLNVLSTTPKSTEWIAKSHLHSEIVLRLWKASWKSRGLSAFYLRVHHGEVSSWQDEYSFHVLTILGPGYRTDEVFDLSKMQPYNLKDLYGLLSPLSAHVILYLPRTSDLKQIAAYTKDDERTTIVHYCMEGASKVSLTL